MESWKRSKEVHTSSVENIDFEEYLGDTGETTHIVKNNNFLCDTMKTDLCGMKVGTGAITKVTEKGLLDTIDNFGTEITLYNVYVVPGITRHSISITQLLREG